MDYIKGTDQDGLFPTFEANAPASMAGTYKNHGFIMYDSIYTRTCNGNSYCNDCCSYNCGC